MKPALGLIGLVAAGLWAGSPSSAAEVGIFEGDRDVGKVGQPGSVVFEETGKDYMISGGGENMWFTNDAFHYVWKEMSGDLSLTADIRWQGASDQPHRKACLIIRQNADVDSPYADAE